MKYETILIRIPAVSAAIIRGSAAFISFSTPDSDVYVDEPVKFIVKKADREGRINIYEKNWSQLAFPLKNKKRTGDMAHTNPVTIPFKEKALPGIQGRRRGDIKVPIKVAPISPR